MPIYLLKNCTHLNGCTVLLFNYISVHIPIRNMEKDMLNGISVHKIRDHTYNLEQWQLYQITCKLGINSTLLFCMNRLVFFTHCRYSHIHLFSILSQTDPLQHFKPSGLQNIVRIIINVQSSVNTYICDVNIKEC